MLQRLIPWWIILSLVAPVAQADAERRASREREQLRRVQMQLQQTQAQLNALEQDKARIAQSLAEAEKARDASRSRIGRLNRELAQERQQRETLQKDLDLLRQEATELKAQLALERGRVAETQARLIEAQARLRDLEADRRALEGVKVRQEREIALCEDRNKALYAIGRDLMTRFERKTCNEILLEGEPFTGIRRVQTENLLEMYRDKLDDQLIIKPPGG
jgi:chromosome segregation ATPase